MHAVFNICFFLKKNDREQKYKELKIHQSVLLKPLIYLLLKTHGKGRATELESIWITTTNPPISNTGGL